MRRPAIISTPSDASDPAGPQARLGDLYRDAVIRLREAGDDLSFPTPELDARLLLGEATAAAPGEVHRLSSRPVPPAEAVWFAGALERRLKGEPVHRIIGRRAFYEHDFTLSPETLEPRPDTELLVEWAHPLIAAVVAEHGTCLFADIGTGTGAIAVSLLALCPQAEAVAIDIAEGALVTARINATAAGVAGRFWPVLTDHLAAIGGGFDLIVSNPPYIPTNEIAELNVAVRRHDPMLALDGGADGLVAYRAIAQDAGRVLRPGGVVILEIGQGQADDVERIFRDSGFGSSRRAKDLAGIERVLVLTSGPKASEAFANPASVAAESPT